MKHHKLTIKKMTNLKKDTFEKEIRPMTNLTRNCPQKDSFGNKKLQKGNSEQDKSEKGQFGKGTI